MGRAGGRNRRRQLEETLRRPLVSEQSLDFAAQPVVAAARREQKRVAIGAGTVQRLGAQLFNPPPAIGIAAHASPFSSRRSHNLARRQSRFTVSADTASASAVSSTLKPPKNRISTTRLLRASIAARASRARSSATTSTSGAGDTIIPSSNGTFAAPPPRFL